MAAAGQEGGLGEARAVMLTRIKLHWTDSHSRGDLQTLYKSRYESGFVFVP